jgi:DME family drug/metabolite transporter
MLGELAALGAALSWTVSSMLYRKALKQVKPVSANIVRLTCTAAILLAFLVVLGKLGVAMNFPDGVVVLAGVSGIIGLGVGDTLYMVSLRSIGVVRSVPITCTYPLFSLLWATFLVGEPVTWPIVLGAVVIVSGVLLLSYEPKTGSSETGRRDLFKGVIFALATAIAWSISITMINLAVKETSDLDHALVINTVRVAVVALALLAASPIIDRGLGFRKMNRRTVATLVAGGIVALGVGWFCLTYSFTQTLESRAVPISSTTPLFSTLTGIALLHEKVKATHVLGSIVIVIGIFMIFLVPA